MPYEVQQDHAECETGQFAVVKTGDGEVMGCHDTAGEAHAQIEAIEIEEGTNDRSFIARLLDAARLVHAGLGDLAREAREVLFRAWDGSPSRWPSTESYCASCLIDVNAAAGRDEKAQSHCKLPVIPPESDAFDFEGIQAAAGGRGITQVEKPDDVPQDDWDSAVTSAANTIIAQYAANDEVAPDSVFEAAGREPPERGGGSEEDEDEEERMQRATEFMAIGEQVANQLWEREGFHRLQGMFLENGRIYVVTSESGRLFRFDVEMGADERPVLGEPVPVVNSHPAIQVAEPPPAEMRTRTSIYRQADGGVRWLSVSCTAILNRVGEIDSRALFDSMVRHAEETGEYPYRDLYHLGEHAAYGQADFLARDGYTFITSGLYDLDGPNADLAQAEIAFLEREPENGGESIQYIPTEKPRMVEIIEGVLIPVYEAGVCRAITFLLEEDAAAIGTTIVSTEVNRMDKATREKLTGRLGLPPERVDELAEQSDEVNRIVESDPAIVARVAAAQEIERHDDEPEIVLDDEAIAAIAGQIAPVLQPLLDQVEDLGARIASLEDATERSRAETDERLVALEQDETEIVEALREDMPRSTRRLATYRPRHANARGNGGKVERGSLAEVAEESLAAIRS